MSLFSLHGFALMMKLAYLTSLQNYWQILVNLQISIHHLKPLHFFKGQGDAGAYPLLSEGRLFSGWFAGPLKTKHILKNIHNLFYILIL